MPFTPVHTLVGGYLLHLSTSSLLQDTGRVFGVSGILDGSIFGPRETWRWATVGGLLAGPLVGTLTGLKAQQPSDDGLAVIGQIGIARLCLAGALVGVGTRLGSGCTSGHMLCGVSRLSPRSIVATITFFTTAVIVANLFPLPIPSSPAAGPAYQMKSASTRSLAILVGTIVTLGVILDGLRRYSVSLGLGTDRRAEPFLRAALYFVYGLTFSLGLLISGMTDPLKVLGFLRFRELDSFDPSLAMIVLGGVLPNAIHYTRTIGKGGARAQTPRLPWEAWRIPSGTDVDWRLVGGAAVFGIGWGVAGVCPGPAIVNLGDAITRPTADMDRDALVGIMTLVGSMACGMGVGRLV